MKEYIPFQTIADEIQTLELPQFEKIVVVTRGGLCVAGLLSQIQKTRNYDTLCIKSYENKEKKELKILKGRPDLSESILIVDDIADSGETLEVALKLFPNAKTFTLHYKTHSKICPDYYIWETSNWIVYPWEFNEQ